MKMQWVWISLVWVGIIVAIIAGLFFFTDLFQKNPIPKNIRESVDFATYYPKDLPEGYAINTKSFELKGNVLIYIIQTPDHKSVSVSQQRVPDGFDFESFQTDILKDRRTIETDRGTIAYSGRLESTHVTSVRDQNTWILLSAPKDEVEISVLESIAKTLRT